MTTLFFISKPCSIKKVSKAIYNIDFQIIERILRLIENFQLMLVLVYEDLDENLQISVWFIML